MAEVEQSRQLDATAEAVWRLVSDPDRLAEWVPTIVASRPAGQGTVHLQGESHGHDYDISGRLTLDQAARRLSWDSPRNAGYQGELTVTGHDGGSTVTVRVSVPDLPPSVGEELERGAAEALDRIGRLARKSPDPGDSRSP